MELFFENDFSSIFIGLCFVAVIVIIVINFSKYSSDNEAPTLDVVAKLITKKTKEHTNRIPVGNDISGASGYHITVNVEYFLIFRVESGDELKFKVDRDIYDNIGDIEIGTLKFKGSRFLEFTPFGEETEKF